MIFVAAGTRDGREIAMQLTAQGYDVIASAVSDYGGSLLREAGVAANARPLNAEDLGAYLREIGAQIFIDATHPYAVQVSQNAMTVCQELHIPYLRYERPATSQKTGKIYPVESYEAAAAMAATLGKNIFLTVGSRHLQVFAKHPALKEANLTTRVLPTAAVLAECQDLGFTPGQIIALQGPFSRELNREFYKKYDAQVIVTKDSGKIGGTDTKLEAAADMKIPVVVVCRPKIKYQRVASTFEQVRTFVPEQVEIIGSPETSRDIKSYTR